MKSWLSRPRKLAERRAYLEEQATAAREAAERTTRLYGAPHVSGSGDPHKTMDAVATANERVLEAFEAEYAAKVEVLRLIETLSDSRQRALLVGIYLNEETQDAAGRSFGLCIKQVRRLRDAAIKEILDAL